MRKSTEILHSGRRPKKQGGAVNPSIRRASTIIFPDYAAYKAADAAHYHDAYAEVITKTATTPDPWYGIAGTSTTFALQDALKKLEHADDCLIVSSGLEAITLTLQSFLKAGDHLLMVDSVYGPTRRFCDKFLKGFGVETTYYDPAISGSELQKLIRKNTKMIYLESPGSLTFEMQDVTALTKVAREHRIITVLDNTWGSGIYYNPLDHGVDVCVTALTKYISGHSDVILGAILTRGKTIKPLLSAYRNLGICTSPEDCWLVLRGLRSFVARMERHERSTKEIVKWLEKQKVVKKILYPAHPKHAGYKLWKRDFTGAASLLTIVLDKAYPEKAIAKFLDNMELFAMGYSWGGFESLIIHFDPAEIRTASKWQEQGTCIRIYVGLEDPTDLIEDLDKGFKRLG